MISRRPALSGASKDSRRSKRPGPQQRRVQGVGAVGRGDEQDVGALGARPAQLAVLGQDEVDGVDEPAQQPLAGRRGVEGLHLHEQLVDDAADALAGHGAVRTGRPGRAGPPCADAGRRVAVAAEALEPAARGVEQAGGRGEVPVGGRGHRHAAADHGDGVDLLDEADRPALGAGGLAQRGEVAADLAGGRAVVHGLERRRGHEEERHAGLAGHRLGGVRLARAGGALEQDAAARGAAQVLAEGPAGEEQVEGALHLGADRAEALDVVEARRRSPRAGRSRAGCAGRRPACPSSIAIMTRKKTPTMR